MGSIFLKEKVTSTQWLATILGFIGIGLGTLVARLEFIEAIRGDLAAWALIAFGLVYFVWGLRRAVKGGHGHIHFGKKTLQTPKSTEELERLEASGNLNMTPWVLFIVFVLGPCEPLIPILMYPAAQSSIMGVVLVAAVFGLTTVLTMSGVVMVLVSGMKAVSFGAMERYTHALAGGMIFFSGVGIKFLGL